jgi:hypothetical protein
MLHGKTLTSGNLSRYAKEISIAHHSTPIKKVSMPAWKTKFYFKSKQLMGLLTDTDGITWKSQTKTK